MRIWKRCKIPEYISLKRDFFNAKDSIDAQIIVLNRSDTIEPHISVLNMALEWVLKIGFAFSEVDNIMLLYCEHALIF